MAAKRKGARGAKRKAGPGRKATAKPARNRKIKQDPPEKHRRGFDKSGSRRLPSGAKRTTVVGGKIDIPGRKADVTLKVTPAEFHEVEPGERQTGLRFVFRASERASVTDDGQIVKRPLYGVARIEYAPTPDHVSSLVMQGKFKRTITLPTKAGEVAEVKINFWPAPPIDGELGDKILKLKREQQEVYMEFWGSYTKEMFGGAEPEEDEEDLDEPEAGSEPDSLETEPETAAAATQESESDAGDETEEVGA